MTKFLLALASLIGAVTIGTNQTEAKSNNKPVTIYLTRHGETTANVMHLAQGWSDYTLTDNGVKGAEYLGKGLKGIKFKAAYSGDLTRQEKTAQGALKYSGNQKVKLKIDWRLRECNYGAMKVALMLRRMYQKLPNALAMIVLLIFKLRQANYFKINYVLD